MSDEKSSEYFSKLHQSIKHTAPPAKPVLPHKRASARYRKYADDLEDYEFMDTEPNPNNCSIRLIEDNVDRGYIFEEFE